MNPDSLAPLAGPLRLLMVEDSEIDHDMLLLTLQRQQVIAQCHRVETEAQLRDALALGGWHAVISDYNLPTFSGDEAIRVVRECAPDLAVIIVSGAIGEDKAVASMRGGADDYLLKDNLARLRVALENAMDAAGTRARRRRVERALLESRQQLRALSAHLQATIESERQQIARELHDEIGSGLTALRYDLNWIARREDAPARERAEHAQQQLSGLLLACQRIVRRLRPPILDTGLLPALEWQIDDFRGRVGLPVTFDVNRETLEVDDEIALITYRGLQEALTNIARHARANRVQASLVVSGDELSLEVSDDGVGICPERERPGHSFGLRGLAERVRGVGGLLEAGPGPRGGTVLLLNLPLRVPAET
ncbi:MAG: histidine kinase [Burkholderiaceae bacterium]